MAHPRPAAVTVLGLAGLLFGLTCVAWLALGRLHPVAELLSAAFGDRGAATRLARDQLATAGPIFATVVPLMLEWALALLLVGAGAGLLCLQRSARWAALFYCVCAIPLQGASALLQAFCLTLPGQPVKLVPIVVNGLVTVFAIVFWGGLFLPGVVAAYAGHPTKPSPQGEEEA